MSDVLKTEPRPKSIKIALYRCHAILANESFVPIVFSKFDSKYWNNYNYGHFGGRVNTRSGIKPTNFNSYTKYSDDLPCHFWMRVTRGIVVGIHETFVFPGN